MKRLSIFLLILWLAACSNQAPGSEGAGGNGPRSANTAVITLPASAGGTDISTGDSTAIFPIQSGDAEVDAVIARLQGLPLDQFFDASYRELLLRDPEGVTYAGLNDALGLANDQLTDLSSPYLRQTQALERATLELLLTYDRSALPAEQQLSYDIYSWYLQDLVAGHEFAESDYPVTFFITSVHQDTLQFFTDIHPITDQQDAIDYITRLSQVETKYDQVIEGLRRREAAGVVPPRFVIQWTLGGIYQIADARPRATPFYSVLAEKISGLDDIDAATSDELLAAAEEAIAASVIPAFQSLADYLEYQESIAMEDIGVWKFPNGAAYYDYLLDHYTTTEMTADKIHELGLQEVARIQAEMELLFADLGYPADESLPQLMQRVARDGGTLFGDVILAGYESLIAGATERVGTAFDMQPKAEVIVVGAPQGGYYVRPAADGSRPGAFYATMQGSEARYSMPTLAYHEAVPGHHFQLAIMQELTGLPAFRNGVVFTVFAEGWALYAEQLAYELGFYKGDPYGNIGRLQGELFRAVRLVVDTGIHARRWTFSEAVNYFAANTGHTRRFAEGQVARYVVYPGQAVTYKLGMMKILELRQRAQDALGQEFDLKAFHNLILQNGSVPLPVLEQIVADFINDQQNE